MIAHIIALITAVRDVVRDARKLRTEMHRKHGAITE